MKTFLLALLLATFAGAANAGIPAAYEPIVIEVPYKFSERLFDLTEPFAKAKAENKPLFIYLGATDCPPCVAYERFLTKHVDQLKPHFANVIVVDMRTWLRGPKVLFRVGDRIYSGQEFREMVGDTRRPAFWPVYPSFWLISPTAQAIKQLPLGSSNYLDLANHIELLRIPE